MPVINVGITAVIYLYQFRCFYSNIPIPVFYSYFKTVCYAKLSVSFFALGRYIHLNSIAIEVKICVQQYLTFCSFPISHFTNHPLFSVCIRLAISLCVSILSLLLYFISLYILSLVL